MPVELTKRIPRRNRSQQGRTDNESPCGDRRTWIGNPLRFMLSSGNCNDICMAQTPLEPLALNGRHILADKGYDNEKFVGRLEKRDGIVVIPGRMSTKHPLETDWHTYKERHLVEKLFLKFKTTAVLPPDMKRRHFVFRLLSALPVSLLGYFDGFHPTSSTTANFLKAWSFYEPDRHNGSCVCSNIQSLSYS